MDKLQPRKTKKNPSVPRSPRSSPQFSRPTPLPRAPRRPRKNAQPINKNFPTEEPFDKAYATPERLQAALYDAPRPAEISEDAWAFGMTVHWLLTGRDELVPGSDLPFGVGRHVGNDGVGVSCAKVRIGVYGAGN